MAIGRAFPIRSADIRSYDAAARPRMRPNPMGVTTIATINGRGAYASARAAAAGRSRSERIARARSLMRGTTMKSNRTHRAAFVKAMRENKKGGKRRGKTKARKAAGKRLGRYSRAYAKYRAAGRSKADAKRLAKKKVFGKGRKGRKSYRRNEAITPSQTRAVTASMKQLRDREKQIRKEMREAIKKAKSEATAAKRAASKKVAEEKKARVKALRQQRKELKATRASRGMRGKVRRKYKRASLRDSSGRLRKSYMYRDKKGRLRKIPFWVLAGGTSLKEAREGKLNKKAVARLMAARQAASKRILTGRGDPFTPNKKRRRKGGKKRSRMASKKRRRKGGKRRKGSKKRRKGSTKRRKGGKRASRKAAGKRLARYSRMVAAYRAKGYSKAKAKRLAKKKVFKKNASKSYEENRGKSYEENRRGKKRRKGGKRRRKAKGGKRRRKGGRRRARRNAFMADLTAVLKVGALVTAGFLIHRVLTSLTDRYLFSMLTAPKEGAAQSEAQASLSAWGKPISGVVVAGVGIALAGVAYPKGRLEIGAGMVASLIQSVVVAGLTAAKQPTAAAYLEGMGGLGAFRGRRRRRRAFRGYGEMTSIAPRYTPVGQIMQAQAGIGYQQAQAGMGEYFKPNSLGEYFVPTSGLQGVGNYEEAGPLALQPNRSMRGVGQIDDGIRPDSDLDRVLTLAESAAGLGEYYTGEKSGENWYDSTVGTQSQWVPNGPLWAGELQVRDTQPDSDLPAGTLAGPGGNGILSG